MCGIAGIVWTNPSVVVDPMLLERMADALRHRGPDDSGVWTGPGVGLAHRRLSIIDLSPSGRQPMSNEDGTIWVTFNGEIYNFQDLRKDLVRRGHVFRSVSDTEVIVHLYEEEGDSCVDRLDGMFAFGLWDAKRRRLLLARDRVGKKPLKYAEIPGGLIFASELKALLASELVDREVEVAQIQHFLTFGHVPSPGTGFAHMCKLEPAHRMTWERGRLKRDRYWSLDYRAKRDRTDAEWRDEVRSCVQSAVERRLVADVPLGAFLSGGIDSSIVVACMARASSRPVETFSIGFEHEAFNELPFARQVAERWNTSHHEFIVRADDVDLLPRLARLYEEPYADSSALPTWFLARETRRHVTVALTGDGGDEGFGGYSRYAQFTRWRRGVRALGPLRRVLDLMSRSPGLAPRLRRQLEALSGLGDDDLGVAYTWILRLCSEREKSELLREEAFGSLREPSSRLLARWLDDPRAGHELLDRVCFTDVMAYLPDDLLVKMDLASMAHSLEARSPLLDHHVLELAASAPAEIRCPQGRLKGLLKDAFREDLPEALVDRPKAGFSPPTQDWFRGPWAAFARELLLGSDCRIASLVRRDALQQAIAEHAAGRIARGYQIYAMVMLELWYREVVESEVRSGPLT